MNLKLDAADVLQTMEDEDRKKMLTYCDQLVKDINWHEIFPKLIEHGIYGRDNINVQRWMRDLHNVNNHREIYLKIMKRGPEAFDRFVQCLKEIGRNDLANILKPDDSNDQVDNHLTNDLIPEINGNNNLENDDKADDNEGSDDYYTILHTVEEPLKVVVKKSTKFIEVCSDGVPCYAMRSNPRGLVLIINNISFCGYEPERLAAEHDEKNLEDLFNQMGFVVQTSRNLTRKAMLDKFEEFSKQPRLRHVHSMFVIVMSHGNEHVEDNRSQSVVCGVDDKFITDTQIFDYFTTTACENMFNKPKIFIFQSCRGDRVQRAVNATNISMGRDAVDINQFVSPPMQPPMLANMRTYADMLVAYSTLPGHKAHRDKHTGSWYIQILCEVLMNHAHNKELTRMLQMVDQRLSQMHTRSNEYQTSSFTSWGFNKQCYLNPGYFEN